jgi:hypothetical protein
MSCSIFPRALSAGVVVLPQGLNVCLAQRQIGAVPVGDEL